MLGPYKSNKYISLHITDQEGAYKYRNTLSLRKCWYIPFHNNVAFILMIFGKNSFHIFQSVQLKNDYSCKMLYLW